jgi:hypothetical protein
MRKKVMLCGRDPLDCYSPPHLEIIFVVIRYGLLVIREKSGFRDQPFDNVLGSEYVE